jgi:hypothetical protein
VDRSGILRSITKRSHHSGWHIGQANIVLAANFHDAMGASQRVQNSFL